MTEGESFTTRVYRVVATIPRGRAMTYAAVARVIGRPRASRAVGNALNRNPYPYKLHGSNRARIPCHRVVRSDGLPGGYSSSLRIKVALLKREGIRFCRGRINPAQLIH